MRLFPLSESALTIEFGSDVSPDLNARAIAIAKHFKDDSFPGLIEAVPAYASVTLFYDPVRVRHAFPASKTAFEAVSEVAKTTAESISASEIGEPRLVEVPINISEEASPDLNTISEHAGITSDEVIGIFLSRTYRVYMLGFLPGFAYMGEVDDSIAAPRLSTPRTHVPSGSVGIAGKQTGIYPLDSPGGWNIIGRTDAKMFDPERPDPCLLRPGDEVKFIKIN
jgi:inhibitor of KinA